MTTRTRKNLARRPVQVAAIALGAAFLVLVLVGVQAFAAGPGPTPPPPTATALPTPEPPLAGTEYIHPEILETAARQAPFSPDREPAPARYRLPENRVAERSPPAPAPEPAAPEIPAFQLLGAVSGTHDDEGWVILTVAGEEPTVLAVGESLHGYRVAQVVGSSAMLTGSAGNFRVTVADPSPSGATVASGADGQAGERRNRAQEAREQAVQQRELQQRALEIARQLQQRVGESGAQVRVDGDRVILTSPDGRNVRIQRVPPAPPQTPPPPTRRPPDGGDR
ncbi:hypothetical protein BH23GEM11_BH23GEM11_18780 [soil metagenome]